MNRSVLAFNAELDNLFARQYYRPWQLRFGKKSHINAGTLAYPEKGTPKVLLVFTQFESLHISAKIE